jgi:hypothetical protein
VSTVDTSTPEVFRRSRPVTTPSGRTKKLGQQLSRAQELLQLIHTWLLAAAACMEAGIVISGRIEPALNLMWRLPTSCRMLRKRFGPMFAA